MKTNYLFYLKFMLLLLFMGGSQLSKATIRYVKANGTGDGSTWELASPSIGSVLSLSKGNDEIWVAAGEYAATSSITMKVRVKIYGGFPATGTPSFSDRNWKTNQTKLKANGNTIFNNNLLINSESILDGFYLTGANVAISNTNGASPTITNCYFESNTNGAINNYSSDPIIFNCIFKQNSSNKGGAIYNESSSAVIKNCIFDSNSTADGTGNGGGAIYLTGNNVNTNITNCIFVNNTASRGADIYSSFGSVKPLTLLNCSFYNNKQQSEMLYLNQTDLSIINTIMIGGTAINNFFVQNGNAPTVRYSLLSKSNSTTNGNIDYSTVDVNSLFVNINKPLGDDGIWGTADDGLALSQRSILINKGDNASYGSSLNTDLDPSGNIRKQYNIIDIGAYESPFYPIPVAGQNNVVYVKKGGAGNCFGTSWDNATPELSIALMAANTNPNIKEIWVAAGTYYPSYRGDNMDNSNVNDFDNTFLLVKDVKIYGGFVGTETANTQSNPAHNPSILSGDLGVANDATDNAYHVVVSANDVGTASLNGFTITGGNAINNTQTASVSINNNIVYRNNGGGIYIVGSSPVFKNVKIENNVAKYGGGIYMDLGSSKPSIVNSLLTNNIAKQYGGAICTDRSSYTLINSTVTKNMGDVNAGGISNSFAESKPQIINSIIWANTKVDNVSLSNMVNSSAVPTISNSIMQESGSSNWQSSFGVDGGNNLDVDPSFSDVANRDFSLQADSPAINQGSNELYISNGGNFSTDKDLADNPRLVGSNIDMGAFERQCNTPAPTGEATQSFNQNDTLAALVVNGQNIKWYATQADAQSHANELPSTTVIVNNTTYYATQTIGQCESATSLAVKAYNATLAVGVNNKIAAIQLFPNPAKDILNLKTDEKIESVDVFSIDGKKTMTNLKLNTNNQLDVRSLSNGVYILQMKTKNKTESVKFIKQ
ncbi:choice-of-anchor Q domain-containing protein [Soonwooa sp.]|uniref:choice-of-anchor Q domain-containing protein n=1 Tax=Soonwooa sp. TaxID=1938592 RepID=UPI00263264AA|nr:choice-of-anchor Q domain-containing protein [Soonwooa sp.]